MFRNFFKRDEVLADVPAIPKVVNTHGDIYSRKRSTATLPSKPIVQIDRPLLVAQRERFS